MVRIGFGTRLVALLIDIALMVGVSLVIWVSLPPKIAGIVVVLAWLAYDSLEIFMAASPGKTILKCKITNQDGTPAPMDKLVLRWAYKQVPDFFQLLGAITSLTLLTYTGGAFAVLIMIGCFFALHPDKLALHDKLFGTAVYGPGSDTPSSV